ncbi:AAEL016989-PA, partial [Aedes aegypti]
SSSAASFSDSHSDDTRVTVDIPKAHVEAPTKTSLTKAMVLQHQTSMSDASIPQSLVVNPSPPPNTTVPVQKKPKPSAEPTPSNFNMNYAKNRYTLKKFIADNDQTFVTEEEILPHLDNNTANDGNDTILSDEIRVGRDAAAPPSFRDDDSSDMQFAGNITMNQASPTRHYPTTPKPERFQEKTQNAQAPNNLKEDPSDANLSHTVTFNGAADQTKADENTMPSSATNASAALQTLMIEQFLSRIHQELDPSLTEFETKVQNLNKMMTDFEPHLLDHDIAEFNQKCEEILEVEDKLDQLFSELTKLCMDTLDRSDKATVTAKKLARYAETKVVFFKEQNQMARQEIPGIVDEYVKSVWNEQVQLRLNQVQLLMTKMLM